MSNEQSQKEAENKEQPSFLRVIVHSFFIIPFLIAVFCLLIFAGMHLLTDEKRTAYDYLEDIKTGGLTKRWQGAFELSKILANPKLLPLDEHFSNEVIKVFEHARQDDPRVRQYLALAMGRTGRREFLEPLLEGLREEKEENLRAIIYALGMLKDKKASEPLANYLESPDPKTRSIAVVALGNIADPGSKVYLEKALYDPEPNVQWGAAISLAKMSDSSGKDILFKLLDRNYLSHYPEVDAYEQNQLILSAIDAASFLNDSHLNEKIKDLSQSDPNLKIRAAALTQLQKS